MIAVADQVWVVNWIYDFSFERLTLFDPVPGDVDGKPVVWINFCRKREMVLPMQHIRDIYQMRINSELKVVSRLFSMAWGAGRSL